MKTYNHLYQNNDELKNFIKNNNIANGKNVLVRIHTACHGRKEALDIAKQTSKILPDAAIVGMSVYSVIYNSSVIDKCCLISISVFESTQITVGHFSFDDKSTEKLATEVCASLVNKKTRVHFTFCSDYYDSAHFYVEEFNKIAPDVKLMGAIAATAADSDQIPFVFTDKGIYENSLLVAALSGDNITTYSNVMIGHNPIGDVHTITKVKGPNLLEIDGVPSAQWFRNLLGISKGESKQKNGTDINTIIVNFPIVLENHNGASRCIKYDEQNDVIKTYDQLIPQGTKFRISYLSPRSSALQCKHICNELQKTYVESIFAYSCFLKHSAMHNCSEWELSPFSQTDISGAFTYGELGNVFGVNEFFNASCTILSLAESKTKVQIHNSAFEKMMTIENDRKDLFNYILNKQNTYIKNRKLAQQVLEQSELVNKKFFINTGTGLENVTKFIYDNEKHIYDKLCMISIEKGELLKGHFGLKTYNKIRRTNIHNMKTLFDNDMVHYYQYDRHAFIIAGKKDYPTSEFMNKVEELFINFGNFNIAELNIPCINHFAVVLEGDRMLEKAGMTLTYAARTGERFMIYRSDNGIDDKINNSMHWVNIINEAIHDDRVVPYFHPIYNNLTGKVTKFESLMRLADKDGKIYYPSQFLDIAKEYKLYLQLSKMMISKVFDLFDERSDMVSINLTARDIDSKEVNAIIFDRLKSLQHPENFIFEIVESEEFRDFDRLMEFIAQARSYGVKIAIDDFGAGYSNLIEIAKIAPDYIKIDGEITRNFMHDKRYKSIMLTVCYLASSLKVDLIAEYVENMDLQTKIKELNIPYTQGYCYSQPLPYNEIDAFCKPFNATY